MPHLHTREQAHELIDRMAPSQVSAVVGLLETMLDPVSRAIANRRAKTSAAPSPSPRLGWPSIPARPSPTPR